MEFATEDQVLSSIKFTMTKRALVFTVLWIILKFCFCRLQKGYHFNPGRKADWQVPMSEMLEHEKNNNSQWVFNFTKHGNCVRANVEPFKMPRKFTFCLKKFHDFAESMNMINLVGTSHGGSILEDFKNNLTWNKIRGQHRMINYIVIHMMHWDVQWITVHETKSLSGGLARVKGQGITWYDWEHWCLGVNFEDGQLITYVNGEFDGANINGDEFWLDPLNQANNLSYADDMITDVLFGCNMFYPKEIYEQNFRSLGKMTDFHLFDRILTADEMVGMTTRNGKKLEGNLLNFNTDTFTVFGENTKEITVSTEEWWPERPHSLTAFPAGWTFPTTYVKSLCKKIKRSVIAVTNQGIKDLLVHALKYMFNGGEGYLGWIPSNIERITEEEPWLWADPITGNDSILPWTKVPKHPQISPSFKYTRVDVWNHDALTRASQGNGFYGCAVCFSHDPNGYRFRVKILGLCKGTLYDTRYTYNWESNKHTYIGIWNGTISYKDGENWLFTSRTDIVYFEQVKGRMFGPSSTIIAPAASTSLALGTYNVPMPDDACTRGKDDKTVKLTITNCDDNEFTCFDGNCVPFGQRCNRIIDCPDLSDERDCLILKLDKTTYIKDYPPITVDDSYTTIKVRVNVSIEVLKILDINEVEGDFEVSFRLHTTWYDGRHTYVNLKDEADLNTLTSSEKEDIWKPFIVFGNTKTQEAVITDEKVIARIGKKGTHVVGSDEEAIRSYYYKGAENTITFSRIYDIVFICRYDMAWYPFDVQRCQLTMKPFGKTGKYISLIRDQIKYLGKLDLSKYYIKQWTFLPKQTNTGDGVEGNKSKVQIEGPFSF